MFKETVNSTVSVSFKEFKT